MRDSAPKTAPPDQPQRERALNPANSILVQAPAGSGKTELLTRRFLRLLTEVEDPGQIVAITFTKAAAAEMRHRILSKLEDAASRNTGIHTQPEQSAGLKATGLKNEGLKGTGFSPYIETPTLEGALAPARQFFEDADAITMESLAHRALLHSQARGWNLLDQPAQLRISTIDSFCREIALQQPLLSGLGDGLGIYDQPDELYSRAARQAIEEIDGDDQPLRTAIESLLLWRDNNWSEMEAQLVEMLKSRDRWMHDFVLEREQDWDALRARLERPFAKTIQQSLAELSQLLDQVPGARDEALALARFACQQGASALFQPLAELADFPSDVTDSDALEEAHQAHLCLAELLLIKDGRFRQRIDKNLGFPADRKSEKAQILNLISRLDAIPGLQSALAAVRTLPPPRYSDEHWQIIRACFTLLRNAAAQLRVVFAEAGAVDYVEVAQIALNVLKDPDGQPSEAAFTLADGIHHILVDEFQDTSRRQHELLRRLIAAWPEREGRSCFVVGDPMQSIYFFRDADAELFPRVREAGLEIYDAEPLLFESVALTSNFRTVKSLVTRLNEIFTAVFHENDGSGVTFSPADPARSAESELARNFELHINFTPQQSRSNAPTPKDSGSDTPQSSQIAEIVTLIQSYMDRMEQAKANGEQYRVAVLGRARNALAPIAQALREAGIPFRSVDLEKLSARPEVLDALSLARALLNPLDRVAWLGLLRAPWCGLSLADLHALSSADEPTLLARPIPELVSERLSLLSNDGRQSVQRLLEALAAAPALRFAQPTASLGTWLQQVWLRLGGAQCVDATARVNLDLLWQCLDSLPNGEQDLLGPALHAALEKLTAQPNPDTSSDCGIQLMTIHKSKGLEFEVVIVPELQAGSGRGKPRMLSWLERGLPPEEMDISPDGSLEVTEFLVAPLQSKGAERDSTKQWVDRVYRDRESQETRRILYVAATRARDELHFFARPACKQEKNGGWTLADPKDSLLATAWPAFQQEIEQRFDAWKSTLSEPEADSEAEPAIIESIAAVATSNLVVMPAPTKPTILRRLPANFKPTSSGAGAPGPSPLGTGDSNFYARHQGGLLSRALGLAVHSLLEALAQFRKTNSWEESRAALQQLQPRVAAQIRAAGLAPTTAANLAAEALRIALAASNDPTGNWILSPHQDEASEVRWTGVITGNLRTVQVDRIFRAGLAPLSNGDETWWIIDYKTAHADAPDPSATLPQLRATFAPQLHAYATVLANLHGKNTPIRAGLYYPRMILFDWWEINEE